MPNLDPNIFGSSLWKSVHFIALGFPDNPDDQQKQQYAIWFHNLSNVIPCEKCAFEYSKLLEKYPPDDYMTDSLSLFQWTVFIHNEVNDTLGKQRLSFNEALRKITEQPPYITLTQNHCIYLGSMFVLILFIVLFYK